MDYYAHAPHTAATLARRWRGAASRSCEVGLELKAKSGSDPDSGCYRSLRVPRHFGNATQPQNMYTSPSGRVVLLGIIDFAHLGHTGAAAANNSG